MPFREELRVAAGAPGTATILGNPDVSMPCEILNFSRSGIGITARQAIEQGLAVKVDWDDHFLVGRVVRCSREGRDYQIGLELLYCSQWKGVVEPAVAGSLSTPL